MARPPGADGAREIIELTATAVADSMVSRFLVALDVELPHRPQAPTRSHT